MEENIIEINGNKVDLNRLSDEKLISLYQNIQVEESKLQELIRNYLKKYPFLKNIEIE